ncbi:MAG: HAMP domain-containing sensor histidine kinase [Spirochaetaceae bacterium]|jgi:signal transduction histidine kinase|nr:HAMP domain-containing sensor histidine kinase [Spirochaetaceae bacterium]
MSKSNTIAIVGAGTAGFSLLSILLQIPGIDVKYVSDINQNAPGLILAKRNDIEIDHDPKARKILEDPEIDMIFEVTGKEEVFNHLQNEKLPSCNIMYASMAKIIFYLLNSQQEVTRELRDYKLKLAERVIERTDELENVNIQLKEQIDLQSHLNEKLQEINNEKTKYLVNATHQLKAPFAAIESYADILIEGYADDLSEKVLKIMHKIKARCMYLSRSIKSMLELANLNSAIEENIQMEENNLIPIVEKVISSEAGILEKRKISIFFTENTDRDKILCNLNQIETLIQILVDNAINYSHENSTIEISIDHDSRERTILSITDHGIGIEEKNLSLIFKEYFRTYNAVSKYDKGTGLGLSIARKIARLHHSDVLVDSKIGKGSTFMIPFQALILIN